MNETLVENPENNVDSGQGGENPNRLIFEGILKGLRGSLKRGVNCGRHLEFAACSFNMLDGRAQRSARSKIKREGNRGEDSLVIDGNGGVGGLVMGKGAERNEFAGLGRNVDGFQSLRGLLELGGDFQHHVILIQTFVDIGDLALTKSVA